MVSDLGTSSYILNYYRIVRPSLFYRMPINIDALYKKPAHGSKKVKWYVQVLESMKSPFFSTKKWFYLRYVYHHFIEEIGKGM